MTTSIYRRCAREAVREHVPRVVYESVVLGLSMFAFVYGWGGVGLIRGVALALAAGLANAAIWSLAAAVHLWRSHRGAA